MTEAGTTPLAPAHYDPRLATFADAHAERRKAGIEVGSLSFQTAHHHISKVMHAHFWLRFGSQIPTIGERASEARISAKWLILRSFCGHYGAPWRTTKQQRNSLGSCRS